MPDAALQHAIHQEARLDAVAALLDGMSHEARVAATRTLSRKDQRALYALAQDAAPLGLDHFVPADRAARAAVRHHGWNALPLPAAGRRVETRCARPEDGDGERLFGYNESPVRGLIGPGYFVAIPTRGNTDWEPRGAIVVDYFQIPDGPVPDRWPDVVPNRKGLQVFVYDKTRDFMRGVSAHVSVGAAYKVENSLDHYFMLVRQD